MTIPDILFHIVMPIYIVGFAANGFVGGMVFATSFAVDDEGPRKWGAQVLLGTPLWPILWASGIVSLLAKAKAELTKEKEEKK